MLSYIPDLLVEPLIADREREARAIARAAEAASRPRGLRARFASRLARLALLLHREAAAGVGEPALGDMAGDPITPLEIQGARLQRR
jgi:hypothetical protein